MKKLVFLFITVLLFSCAVKRKTTIVRTYKWENKMVTKKEYDSLLRDHTYKFVENYKQKD